MSNTTISLDEAKQRTEALVGNSDGSLRSQACLMTLPDISMPTGKKTVKKKELTLHDGRKITSNKLSGGAIDWFPQEKLSDFGTLRKQAYKIMEEKAVNLGGFYLVSLENLSPVLTELSRIENEWLDKVNAMDQNFDSVMQVYKAANADIETLITDYSLPRGEFMSVFKFQISPPLAVQPLFPEQEHEIAKKAVDSLWSEICNEAKRQYNTSFAKGENVSQRAITALHRIRDKLVSMSFLDAGIDVVVDTFDSVISRLPKAGYVDGNLYHELGHFVTQLGDEDRMRRTAAGEDNGLNINAFFKAQTSTFDTFDVDPDLALVSSLDVDDDLTQLTTDDIQTSSFDDDFAPVSQTQIIQTEMDWMQF